MICNLCPRRCGVERTPDKAAGVCAMPAWPVAARAMLHQWEEPCLVGEHGAGAVFFSGCNLRCKFCQNGVISQEGYGKPMIYFAITAAVFTLDFFLKKYIDKKYARKVKNPRLGGIICIEKFYNKGATLNLLAKHPKAMTVIHSVIMVFVAVVYYFAMRMTGKKLTKTGLAMLAGGGLSNLYDRYTKHHVVDYVRFQTGPKWFRRIIFNVSDFFIFIGAVLAVIGSEV